MNESWVCIGHSHVRALARAAQTGGWGLDAINFWETGEPWLRGDDGSIRLRPDLATRIAQGRLILSLIGGSAHTVLGMVEHPRPFDFVLPSEPDLPIDETREIVPAEAVRTKLVEIAAEYLETVPVVVHAARCPLIQIEPPPPVAARERISPHVPWALYPGQPRVIAPKWLRYKLWRMHSEVIAMACASFGVRYVRSPDRAKDGEGFLDPRYDEDGAHANAAYGLLVLEDLGRAA